MTPATFIPAPSSAAQARAILSDAALCADRPTLADLARAALATAHGLRLIQTRPDHASRRARLAEAIRGGPEGGNAA